MKHSDFILFAETAIRNGAKDNLAPQTVADNLSKFVDFLEMGSLTYQTNIDKIKNYINELNALDVLTSEKAEEMIIENEPKTRSLNDILAAAGSRSKQEQLPNYEFLREPHFNSGCSKQTYYNLSRNC